MVLQILQKMKKLNNCNITNEGSNNDLLLLRECLVDYKNRGMDEESMYFFVPNFTAIKLMTIKKG